MNRTRKWLIVIVCLIFLVGCNGKDKTVEDIGGSPVTYEVIGEDPIIVVHESEGGMEMEIEGILVYDYDSKYLLLENLDAQASKYSTPIWPKNTKPFVENEQHGVEIPGYGKVIEGDSVYASGGGIDREELDGLNIPDQLFQDYAFVVISQMEK